MLVLGVGSICTCVWPLPPPVPEPWTHLPPAPQVMPPFPEDRFLCSFGHIFAGGYSAGYFSYK